MKKNNKKGFTLAELLIVVAIIAVLVAIAIPVFTAQLKKSQLATNTANVRSAYAEAVASALADGASLNASGKMSVTMSDATDSNANVSIDNDAHTVTVKHAKQSSLANTFSIDEDVKLSIG